MASSDYIWVNVEYKRTRSQSKKNFRSVVKRKYSRSSQASNSVNNDDRIQELERQNRILRR